MINGFHLIYLTKLGKYNTLKLLYVCFLERNTMHKGKRKFIFSFIIILHFCFITGCMNKGAKNERLYFEPPLRLINDYTGMIEVKEINWVWLKLGVKFSNYRSITIKPFQDLTSIDDQNVCEKVHRELITWFENSDLEVSDAGEIICEGALVELKHKRNFIKGVNPFYEKVDDLSMDVEIVIKEDATQDIICKIRHGAIGSEIDAIVKSVLAGLITYFDSHM